MVTHADRSEGLVVPEELDPHPAPEVEEDVDRNGDWQQQAVEAQTAAAGAALREVLIHGRRVEQTKERHDGDQTHQHRQGQHPEGSNHNFSTRTLASEYRNAASVSLSRRLWLVFPYEPGVLRDHVGDAVDDGVSNAKLLIDQLVGVRIVSGKGGRKTRYLKS